MAGLLDAVPNAVATDGEVRCVALGNGQGVCHRMLASVGAT
jgi:hypothetical protein